MAKWQGNVIAALGLLTMLGCMEIGDSPEVTLQEAAQASSACEDPSLSGVGAHDTVNRCAPPAPDPDPNPPPPPPPPPPASIFRSSSGVGGTGPIRDLKFEKGDSASQSPLAGYHLIPADLNKGAQGTYIYLTFTRDSTSVQTGTQCGWETGEFVTGLLVHDYNWFDVAGFKGVCVGIGAPWTPIWEDTHNPLSPWKHPDLNDGSGGRFILAWQAKVDGSTPVTEVGVVSGSSSAIRCPSGWIKDSNDLNKGAGGDYIYFCYKH